MGGLFGDDFLGRLEYLRVLARRLAARKRNLASRLKKTGSGSEFADHRPYAAGDDFRAIDWNVFSRLGRLIVRLFEEDEELHVHFLLDASASMAPGGKFDYARRVVAALAYLALSNIDRVTVHAFNSRVTSTLPPKSGRGQVLSVMKFLETLEPEGETDVESAARDFASRTRRRGLVVILSDFFTAGEYAEAVKFLCYRRFDLFAVHVVSVEDETPGVTGDLALKDSESAEVIPVSPGRDMLRAYRDAFAGFQGDLEKAFVKHGALVIPAPVRIPFEELVSTVMREGLFVSR